MTWFTDRHWFLLAVVAYGLSTLYSVFLRRKGFRKDDGVNYLLLALGFLGHTTAMWQRGFSLQRCPVSNLFEATMFTAWTIVAIYLLIGLSSRLRFLGAFASPVLLAVGVFALMPELDTPPGPEAEPAGGWISLHAALIMLAYGAFGLAAVAAVMYLTQEHDLKFRKLQAVFSRMPPIQRLEGLGGRLLVVGFVLLTAGLMAGGVGMREKGRTDYWQDSKVIWSLGVWLLYLVLLFVRWRFTGGGRRMAWGIIGGFAFVMLTFWGSNLLSAIHNP